MFSLRPAECRASVTTTTRYGATTASGTMLRIVRCSALFVAVDGKAAGFFGVFDSGV